MPLCLVGLGSNLGDRRQLLNCAVAGLQHTAGIQLIDTSRWYETAPIGGPVGQPNFFNGAVTLETSLAPHHVLAILQQIENKLARRRVERWGPRTIDLDLLLYGSQVIQSQTLVVPHPRMARRRFVLEPAAEVASSMIHPTTNKSIAELLDDLNAGRPTSTSCRSVGT